MACNSSWSIILSFTLLLSSAAASATTTTTTITPDQPLVDGGDGATLVSSAGGVFELGFFSPQGSTSRYVGIWYKNIPIQTVVWVANREAPLINDSSGVLNLTADGNLTLHDRHATLWSTNTSSLTNPTVHLLDSGNLVLSDGTNTTKWQSFDYPSDTMLPGMEIARDPSTNLDRRITSWKNASDPSPGPYTLGISLQAARDIYIWNGSVPVVRSGPWDGDSWGGSASFRSRPVVVVNYISRGDGVFVSYDMVDNSVVSPLVMEQSGVLRRLMWESQQWITLWLEPTTECDRYAHCGVNGLCDSQDMPVCKCLPGFLPKSLMNIWNPLASTDGCRRRTALGCSRRSAGDGFRKVTAVRVPDMTNATADGSKSFEECREGCLSDCKCTAFAFLSKSSGCISWFGDLVDVQQLSVGTGQEFYLRLAASELAASSSELAVDPPSHERKKLWVIIIGVIGALPCVISIFSFYTILKRKNGKRGVENIHHHFEAAKGKDLELPLLRFSTISTATKNFSLDNKLGEGGFGPVYKGMLFDVQVAVKRLSRSSAQGLEEFKSEIKLLAKLQHTNLVRILGSCIEAEEKIVVYEYMENGSLDKYLFDPNKGAMLDWSKRVHIIKGITQGLLYLHKYSRLRVIHRDLKASNILLDVDMNPKISDFGLARIFSLDKSQINTNRVVGTYGYMSPEYAMEGLFSVKSDVFSFGVLLLEILSGKRNFNHQNLSLAQNLLGYAWELWIQGKEVDLMDISLGETCPTPELSKYVKVALLCVQELAIDRPTITDVFDMFSNQSATLPAPKQPAFIGRYSTSRDANLDMALPCSNNCVTLSLIDGR